MNVLYKNYKLRISFIVVVGLFIVSIITAIALYAMYHNVLSAYKNDAQKVVRIYEDALSGVVKDLEYLHMIDYSKDDAQILEDFKKFSLLIYEKNNFINGLGLVKQFDKKDLQEQTKIFSRITKRDNFSLKSIVEVIQQAKVSQAHDLLSVMLHRTPHKVDRDIIGLELSSEEKRKESIDKMNLTGSYYLTAPVKVVNDDGGHKYSSILYYPLELSKNKKYYKWYVVVPMTSQKILNELIRDNYYFKHFNIFLFDKIDKENNKYQCLCDTNIEEESTYKTGTVIKEHMFSIGDRDRKFVLTVDDLYSFKYYWPAFLGFSSGIIFIIAIGYYLVFKEEKELEIKNISNKDHLTGIYNRVYFDEKLEEYISNLKRYEKSFCLILIDIDYFKNINDRYGHAKGDEVLIVLTTLIQSSLRKTDFLARWGGEEFIIILPATKLDQASFVAEKLRKLIKEHKFSQEFCVTASFGVAQASQKDNESSLFKRVDSALYQAKENGRDQVVIA